MSKILSQNKVGKSDLVNSSPKQLNRRELGKLAFAGALGAAGLGLSRFSYAQDHANPALNTAPDSKANPGVKLACQCPSNPTEDDLLFYKQVGVDSVYVTGSTPEYKTVEGMLAIKKRFADAGLVVEKINSDMIDRLMGDIVLNGPGRDKAIEGYKAWIHTLAGAGFFYIPQMFGVTGPVSSGVREARGARVKSFDLDSSELEGESGTQKGVKGSANSLLFGREYSKDEIWANYTYFIKQVTPVAEEAGVRIGFHPDDPPAPSLFGVPRILSSFDDFKKAMKIANSPNVGVLLCCGTWEEGGAAMGIDTAGALRYFATQKKLFEVHFRNVSSPLPRFNQTFPDYGYYDTYKIMKTLVDVKYDGVVQLENTVQMVGGVRTYEAFALGYMRAMLQRAQAADAAKA